MDIGNETATFGMTKAIYDKMRDLMEPIDGVEGETLDAIREGWRKLAFAVAHGVVTHIAAEAEVIGVVTHGDIAAEVVGTTATQENVAFAQNAAEPGRIE